MTLPDPNLATPPTLAQPRLRLADLLPVATVGLRTRRVRAVLSILGVAIGVAALVAVLGITRSSQADLLAQVDRLGTNLLTVVNGQTLHGDEVPLPGTAATAIRQTDGVLACAPTAALSGVGTFRTDRVPAYRGGSVTLRATDPAGPEDRRPAGPGTAYGLRPVQTAGPSLPAGAGGPGRPGPGPVESRDRPGTVHRRGDGEGARVEHPRQAAPGRPDPGSYLRATAAGGTAGRGPGRLAAGRALRRAAGATSLPTPKIAPWP